MSVVEEQRRPSLPSKKPSRETLGRRQSERHHVLKIQNYVIYRKTIGAGSMGKVKLAECLTDKVKQKYAVKIMPKVDLTTISGLSTSRSKDPKDTPEEREQRTIREMAIMRLLRHPNICQLKEYISEGDKYYMFLEYVDGGQLLDYIIKHGKLREKQGRKFARQIVSALDYCHRNSIVHRDLKIENILITQSEQLKIIDFGLSNVYSPTEQLNTFCGSLYFAAPELLKAKQYTGPEVDVWSFGVVLYVLVCGKVPFDDTNLPALHEKIKSGIVEDYPDHLGKDCLDLLSKIFVVDPSKRITLAAIQTHPWMTKNFEDPIRNYLPHRQPLEQIDMSIVNGMHGFGLGSPEEIAEKLQRIVSSSAYQVAATRIDQNFVKQATDDQILANRPRWRRTLSTRKRTQTLDDFQTLPAMYDPLVSIYYLVKERKESDERKKKLLETQSNPVALSRSTSTRVTSTIKNTPPLVQREKPSLVRRSTFDTPKQLSDIPAPITPHNKTLTKTLSTSESENLLTNIPKRRTTLLRQKSLQAIKKLGIKLPNNISHSATDQHNTTALSTPAVENTSNLSSSSSVTTDNENKSRTSGRNSVLNNSSNSSKPHWLKLELNSKHTLNKQQKRDSANSTTNNSTTTVRQPSWRKMSFSRHTRLSFDDAATQKDPMSTSTKSSTIAANEVHINLVNSRPKEANAELILTSSKSEVIFSNKKRHSQPKSIFHFNRGHLFRVTPEKMMRDLQQVLESHNIRAKESSTEAFTLQCYCSYSVWSKYIRLSHHQRNQGDESMIRDDESFFNAPDSNLAVLNFDIMIYEARWASGKIGFKVKEDMYQQNAALSFYVKQVLKNLYHCLLNDISHPNHSALSVN